MKVILNRDLLTLGEEGDVKDVAKGYARNYLFPRGIALPYTPQTVKLFEARKEEIEARKSQKRQDSLGLKEKLENLEISLTMPAGLNGKLYGAVTAQTIVDELAKLGFDIDRKKIDLAVAIKSAGKYKAGIRLYESSRAEIQVTVIGQEMKTESANTPTRPARRRRDEEKDTQTGEAKPEQTEQTAAQSEQAAAQPEQAETAPEAGSEESAK